MWLQWYEAHSYVATTLCPNGPSLSLSSTTNDKDNDIHVWGGNCA